MKSHKYEVEIEPKKLELSIAVTPVKASVLFKRGKEGSFQNRTGEIFSINLFFIQRQNQS